MRSLPLRAAWLALLVPAAAFAAAPRPDVLLLAWSSTGELALVQETAHESEGGSALAYRVVGPGVDQTPFVVSRVVVSADGRAVQEIGVEPCRKALVALRDLLKARRFKGITLSSQACSGERSEAVSVAPEQASEAEASELEPVGRGDSFAAGDWTLRLGPTAVSLAGPGERKRLRLPRPLAPAAAHVLLSPSRRLLLILESSRGGDQVLAAGFSSRTGRIADFE